MIATATHTHYNIQDKSRVLVAAYELSNIEPVCFATPDNGTTVYSSTTAIAAQQAVDAAGSGGTVKLAGICAGSELVNGTSQIIYTNQPISLAGGFTTTNWLASDPTVNNTVLDALGNGRAIYATQPITISALRLQNGNGEHSGGGAYFLSTALLSNVTFFSNTSYYGGGAWFQDDAILKENIFVNNRGGNGGGAYFYKGMSLLGDRFENNSANQGGGLYKNGIGKAIVEDAIFTTNRGMAGGGAYFLAPVVLTRTTFISNIANYAGGSYFRFDAVITGSTFNGNIALPADIGGGTGGGVRL